MADAAGFASHPTAEAGRTQEREPNSGPLSQAFRRRLAIHAATLTPQPSRATEEGSGTTAAVPGEPMFCGTVVAEANVI